MPISVAIVEDKKEMREGLQFLVASAPPFRCVAACNSAESALMVLPPLRPDVVLLDVQLPGMSGIEAIPRLRAQLPAAQLMMLTVVEDHDRIFQSLRAGATGYLLKNTPPAKLLEAIQEVHDGGSPMSAQIARRVVDAFQNIPAPAASLENLSGREQEILQLLSQGLLYKEIADRLTITVNTVRTHLRRIYEKLHVRSRSEAMLKLMRR